jgi:peptidoglycan glycosyltransferase
VVAEALHRGVIDDLEGDVGSALTERIAIDGFEVTCSVPPEGAPTLAHAYAAGCPAPIRDLGRWLGADGLAEAVARWRLTVPPPLAIPTESSDWSRSDLSSRSSVEEEAVGQGALTVTPLQMARVAATLANGGEMPDPRLALRVQGGDGGWRSAAAEGGDEVERILSAADAQRLLAAWRRWDASGHGDILGHGGVAVAGEGAPHAWFLGVAPGGAAPRYAVAVLVEHTEERGRATVIGRELLEAALAVSPSPNLSPGGEG